MRRRFIAFAVGLIVALGAFVFWQSQKERQEEPVFCTQDAKQCPDGSYVGRVAPKCEFAPCPTLYR